MEDNGDLKRNRAMSAGERRFFFKKTFASLGFPMWSENEETVIVCYNVNAAHVRNGCNDNWKIYSILLVMHPRVNVDHPVVQSMIGFLIRILKSLCCNSTNRYHVVFSILQ